MSVDLYVKVLSGSLSIKMGDARDLVEEYQNEEIYLPEVNFLTNLDTRRKAGSDDLVVAIEKFYWYGEGAGDITLLKRILSLTLGTADLLLVWGHDEFSGLRVKDGKVEEMGVRITLKKG